MGCKRGGGVGKAPGIRGVAVSGTPTCWTNVEKGTAVGAEMASFLMGTDTVGLGAG